MSVANMPLFRMSLSEALSAATINAAHSLGRGATHGSIEVGKVPKKKNCPQISPWKS